MSGELISAIIAFAGVVLSTAISLFIAMWNRRYNYDQLFAETVSQSRNKWLNEIREYLSEMLANKRRIVYENLCDSNVTDVCNKYDACRYQVLMRLNIEESLHRELRSLIMALELFDDKTIESGKEKDYIATEMAIIEVSREILKEEWDKVKTEAKGE